MIGSALGRRRITRGWAATLLSLFAALDADSSKAELVLLVGGGVLKVDGFSRTGDRIDLQLSSGGTLELSIWRIDRILADEIEDVADDDLGPGELEIGFSSDHEVPDTPYGELIFVTAERHALNPHLIAAMVRTESAFDPKAVSRKGAAGLLQLMPATAQRFGISRQQVFVPEHNLDAGVRYLRWLVDRFEGDLALVLAGYNAGEAAVDRYGGVPPYKETREYIRRVYSAAASTSDAGASE